MNDKKICKNIVIIIVIFLMLSNIFIILPANDTTAGSYNGADLALAILSNSSWLVSSSYTNTDPQGHRQAIVLSSLGTMYPTDGPTFALLSTGIAGTPIVTTGGTNPGSERGTWFISQYGYPRDEATLTMVLAVPQYMHYLYYDFQFFSAEYPEYVGSQYNDKFTITVNSPSKGVSTYVCDVNSGNFVLDSNYIPGTGFNIFAQSGNPEGVDWVDTTPRKPGADAGATPLVTRGGQSHPVSPLEQITVTFDIIDTGDNQFDSAAFIDNLMFSGYARTVMIARKEVRDLTPEPYKPNDTIEYTLIISNTGTANQNNNPGNEFEDPIPANTAYVPNSATATSGTIAYDQGTNKIIWNGAVPKESSVVLTYQLKINENVQNGTIISNQGTVLWDSNEDGINDATELTDDSTVPGDHNPTNITVIAFVPPSEVTEDFSDDLAGGIAKQSYFGRQWFETNTEKLSNDFEVVSGYHFYTANAFKTQLRASGGSQYWNYTLSNLESDIKWWEIMFACGNGSEESDLYLTFKNGNGNDIAKIKFEYVHAGTNLPTDWVLKLYYWSSINNGWELLHSNFTGGYLYNGWYKLKIEKNEPNHINYSLYRGDDKLVDFKIDDQLSAPFSNLVKIEWSSTKNPVHCPMFFWDEHKIGLKELN